MESTTPHDTIALGRDKIQLGGIAFTRNRIFRIKNDHVVQSIPRSMIETITLRHGFKYANGCVEAVVGVLALAAAVIGVILASDLAWRHAPFSATAFLLLMAFLLAARFQFDAFRQGYFLRIVLRSDVERWLFEGEHTPDEMAQFVTEARKRFGYPVFDS